ncbi:MAG: hypothetical protein SNJ79_01315 [Sphingomonadaceae bacterium]
MSTATTDRAEFLKQAERFAVALSSSVAATWGEDALESRQSSCLHLAADAQAEANRQRDQLAAVRARDLAVVEGLHLDLEGATVRLAYNGRLGVAGEADMLVIRVRVDRNRGLTELEGEVLL